MDPNAPRLAMVAGEASGDLLAGLLLAALRKRWPQLRAAGIGGPSMAQQGFEAWWPHDKLAVRGYFEVLRHYREILAIRKALAARLLDERPDAFIGVDAPDFNLHLETQLKAQRIKSIHFVSPSIWAWRSRRIEKIKRAVDHVLCLFPFEPVIYAQHGIAATYVGHPLADVIPEEPPRAASRVALGLTDEEQVVALLPGSRRSEIEYVLPAFMDAAVLMHRAQRSLRFVLPIAHGLRPLVEPIVAARALTPPVLLVDGRSHEVLAACDVTLIASGTATLEAALFKRPMVIAYRMHELSWQMMKRMRLQPWVGLPNVLLKEFVVPELLQRDASPSALAKEALAWLGDRARVERVTARFAELHHSLRRDTGRAATDAIAQILER
jgi:lipid-A-disaccharide synthase